METAVADTSALVSLAIPWADARNDVRANPDPLQYLLTSCSVYVPDEAIAELEDIAQYSDIHAVAAANVLSARDFYTVEDPYVRNDAPDERPTLGLDDGETDGIVLANVLADDAFLSDEFGSDNFSVIHAALEGPRLVPSPRLIRDYALDGHMSTEEAKELVEWIGQHRSWEGNPYVEQLLETL